jgi:hypothetical protein
MKFRSPLEESSALWTDAAILTLIYIDILFAHTSFVGAIINIHFLLHSLFPLFAESLIPGGYLLIETVPGCGGNYVQLPKINQLRTELSQMFEFEFYKENHVGPPSCEAVTVRLAATRKTAGDITD